LVAIGSIFHIIFIISKKDISKTQDDEVGDGTTTVAVLAGELLREGEKLVNMKIHPQHIIEGWRKAKDVAKKVLNEICKLTCRFQVAII